MAAKYAQVTSQDNVTRMETSCGGFLQSLAVSGTDGLSSGPWPLRAQLGGGAHVSAQRALCVRALLCRISLALPTMEAEESEGDGDCCIAGGLVPPRAPQPAALLERHCSWL